MAGQDKSYKREALVAIEGAEKSFCEARQDEKKAKAKLTTRSNREEKT